MNCEICDYCQYPRTPDDNNGLCKCKAMKRKTIDVYVGGGETPEWCPLNKGSDTKKPQETKRYDILPGGRLTTDDPTNNTQTMLNYAYAEDGRVILRYGDGEEDIDLCEYISREAADKSCHPTPAEVMEGVCLECDCPLAILYVVATQAAELRARLKEYEDNTERHTPKSPEFWGDGYDDEGNLIYDNAKCPNCGNDDFEYGINNWGCAYCPDCGQALDWGDNK